MLITARHKAALKEFVEKWNHDMEKVKKDGRLKIGTENQKNSITYIPNTVEETTEFTRLLITEMRLRGRSTLRKSLAQMQEELLECLTAEKYGGIDWTDK